MQEVIAAERTTWANNIATLLRDEKWSLPDAVTKITGQPFRLFLLDALLAIVGDPDRPFVDLLVEGVRFCRCAAFEEVSEGWVRAVPEGLPELQERYAQTAVGKLGLVKSPGRPDRVVVDSNVSRVTEHTALPNKSANPSISGVRECLPPEHALEWLLALILDVSKAHRRIMIRPSDRGLLCFFHRLVLYQCLTLNFGARACGFYWSRLAGLLTRLIHRLLFVRHCLFIYVDDLIALLSGPSAPVWAALVCILLLILQVPMSWHKAYLGDRPTWIGWQMCFHSLSATMEPANSDRLRDLLSKVRSSGSVPLRLLRKLTGKLLWVCSLFRPFRPSLAPLYLDQGSANWDPFDYIEDSLLLAFRNSPELPFVPEPGPQDEFRQAEKGQGPSAWLGHSASYFTEEGCPWHAFLGWLDAAGIDRELFEDSVGCFDIDTNNVVLAKYGRALYAGGRPYSHFCETINSFSARVPNARRLLQPARDVAFAWRKSEPTEHHAAMPWQVLVVLLTLSLTWGWVLVVAGPLALTFGGMLRMGRRPVPKVIPEDVEGTLDFALFSIEEPKTRIGAARHQSDLPALEFGDSSFPEALSAAALGALQLARALYVEAEILLLDEPFASMELERAKRVLSNLVRKAKDRTVVLATQTLSVLGPMDSIVVLRNGTVFEQGDYKTLASMPTEFSRLLLIAKEKEKRSRESRNGFACPCMCYEVAPDPLRELYPFDEEFGTFPTFGFGSVLEAGPRKWVSQQPLAEPVVAHLTPAIPAPTAASPSEAAGAQLPPSASAVPAVGASEAGGFLTRAAESPAEVPELPEEEGIPRPNTSAAAREVPGPIVPPRPEDPDFSHGASSPSADGLRRRSAAALDSEAPLTSPVLRTDAIHSAPLPQRLGKPEDEGKDIKAKRRRPEREDKEPKHSGSQRAAHARDAVEEKQGFLSSSSSSFGHYHQEAAPSLPKGRGNGVLLLLGHSGHASAMMAAVLAIGMLANLSVPILLSYVVAEVPTAVPSNTSTGTTRSPADMTTSATTEVSVRTSPRPVIPPFQPGTTDDSEVVWRGFSTTSSTEASPPSATSTTSTTELSMSSRAPSQEWSLWSTGHFCAEPDLAQETRPEGSYDLDATVGWHWSTKLSLADCKLACEELADWACRFISWGGPASTERWCYVHRHCSSMMRVPMYQIMEVNFTASPMRLRRRLTAPASTASIARGRRVQGSARHGRQLLKVQIVDGGTTAWISQNSARVLLAALSSLLPLMGLWQARAACLVAIQASHKGSQLQLRALLAEAGRAPGQGIIIAGSLKEDLQQPTGTSRRQSEHSLLQDIADADHFLPLALPRCILALCQVLAALLCTAAACSRQAVPAVMLTILVASAMYFHHRRLSLVQQLRRFANRSEAAAALQMLHLTECHEALCLHGHGDALWKNYEACCKDAALAGLASDAAERWLYSCLHVLVALLLGLLSFSAMTQAQSLPSDFGFAVAVASVVQVAMVPDALVEFVKHGAQLTHGLAALRRMAQTCKEAAFEELESPIATLEIESRGFKPAAAALVSRSGKVALGDVLIENENLAEIAEPQVPSQSQSISHAGFPMEKVPGDWPYFGAIEFEKVTVRYGPGLSPALSSCSLVLPAGKALLVTGAKGCGKSSLLKAVLRCCYIESGRVVLDAVDVRCVSLATLRGRVAVVPQELCIFNGSWRQNLDPMGEFDEDELKRVLRLTRLENFLLRTASDLDATIAPEVLEPGPAAASAVLLCLCRALLRLLQGRSKLLMMDAATCRFNPASDADLTAIILRYCRQPTRSTSAALRRGRCDGHRPSGGAGPSQEALGQGRGPSPCGQRSRSGFVKDDEARCPCRAAHACLGLGSQSPGRSSFQRRVCRVHEEGQGLRRCSAARCEAVGRAHGREGDDPATRSEAVRPFAWG
eukprot:s433_g23.t1